MSDDPGKTTLRDNSLSRHERYKRAAALLNKWEAASGNYDERVWPVIEEELRDSTLRCSEDESAS